MENVIRIFYEIKNESSIIGKKRILQQHEENVVFKRILKFLLDPFVVTGISQKKIEKRVRVDEPLHFSDFLSLMEFVASQKTGSDSVINQIQLFLTTIGSQDEIDFYKAIITKSLKIGCDIKTINSVYGEHFIHNWEVQQSYRYESCKLKKGEWFSLSQKLNGVRGTFYNGKLISRQGKEFIGFEHIIETIRYFHLDDLVLDGELIRYNKENIPDNENFRIGTGIINSDESSKEEIMFVIFDVMSNEEFESGQSYRTYKDRLKLLTDIREKIGTEQHNLRVVDVLYSGCDQSCIETYLQQMVDEDKEGLMLNRDTPYYCKRHNGILKIKRFYTVDLAIIDFEEGTGRLKNKLGAFIVDYKGNPLHVGTGITDDQREFFWDNRADLLGRVIEVKYKEESLDQKTKQVSLQFPVFVCMRELGKAVSYN